MSSENIKVSLVGESKVGKTSVIRQFREGKFYLEGEPKKSELKVLKKINTDLHLYEANSDIEKRELTKFFMKSSKGIILMYDITNENSFKALKDVWFYFIKEFGATLFVVANKNDLEEKKVKDEEGKEFAQSIGADFFSVTATDNNSVTELFTKIEEKLKNK